MSLTGSFGKAWEYRSAALPNMYEVRFNDLPFDIGGSDSDKPAAGDSSYQGLVDGQVAYRCKSITIPGTSVSTTDIDFMGIKIKIPNAKLEMQYEFTTDFRIDKYWALYRDLVRWRNRVFEPSTGRFGMDIVTVLASKLTAMRCGSVEVAIELPLVNGAHSKEERNFKPLRWRFSQVFPFKLSDIALNYESGNTPISINVSFGFLTMKEYFADELDT